MLPFPEPPTLKQDPFHDEIVLLSTILKPLKDSPFWRSSDQSFMSSRILVHFRSPRHRSLGIQNYFNRKGLISDQREKKEGFYVLLKA